MATPIQAFVNYYRVNKLLSPQLIDYMEYSLRTLWNEIVKILLYWPLFALFKRADAYWFTLSLLIPLRWTSGGLHCKTFYGCLICSFLSLAVLILLSPLLPIYPLTYSIVLLLIAVLSLPHVPYTPAFRPISNDRVIFRLRCFYILMIGLWLVILNIVSLPPAFAACGFYTLFFQCGQLLIPRKEIPS